MAIIVIAPSLEHVGCVNEYVKLETAGVVQVPTTTETVLGGLPYFCQPFIGGDAVVDDIIVDDVPETDQ